MNQSAIDKARSQINGVGIIETDPKIHQWCLVEIKGGRVSKAIFYGLLPEVLRRYKILYKGYADRKKELGR